MMPRNPFTAASGQVRPMPELALVPDAVFTKEVHSAMFAPHRRRHDPRAVAARARHRRAARSPASAPSSAARPRRATPRTSGYSVRYVTDATLTFPMRDRAGREVSPAEIRERTELVLDGRFAQIVSTAGALG